MMLHFYKFKNNTFVSRNILDSRFISIKENEACTCTYLYIATKINKSESNRSFIVSSCNSMFISEENINLLLDKEFSFNLPKWIMDKIKQHHVISLNLNYESWEEELNMSSKDKWTVNIAGLGDVGSTLLLGLKLLGESCISKIGIYDKDILKMNRWEFEVNQICTVEQFNFPKVIPVNYNNLFNCDMFIFCISKGIPPISETNKDVRLCQFEENAKILAEYIELADLNKFKGIFAIVSDPVDLLCSAANKKTTTLLPEQIRGYGLGVMNARASYYSIKDPETKNYELEGRAFGPHGENLLIVNSISNFNEKLSEDLTIKAKNANLQLRQIGYKPFIAPAISSGTLSIISTIKGEWNYSSVFLGGTYFGCKNKFINGRTLFESNPLCENLYKKLTNLYEVLKKEQSMEGSNG